MPSEGFVTVVPVEKAGTKNVIKHAADKMDRLQRKEIRGVSDWSIRDQSPCTARLRYHYFIFHLVIRPQILTCKSNTPILIINNIIT